MKYFTSDTHFNHANIIKYCNRPFASVEEMNEELIKRWNEKVTMDDEVYHLGDFGFFNSQTPEKYSMENILNRLNGRIYLVLGNHDNYNMIYKQKHHFVAISNMMREYAGKYKLIMSHYPLLCFDGSNSKTINLFGHVHSGPTQTGNPDFDRLKMLFKENQYDVGVDNNDYAPVSFTKVLQKLGRLQ